MLQLLRKMKNNMSYYSYAFQKPQVAFLDKLIPDIDTFTDEPVFHQCDVQLAGNIFVDDSK